MVGPAAARSLSVGLLMNSGAPLPQGRLLGKSIGPKYAAAI